VNLGDWLLIWLGAAVAVEIIIYHWPRR